MRGYYTEIRRAAGGRWGRSVRAAEAAQGHVEVKHCKLHANRRN